MDLSFKNDMKSIKLQAKQLKQQMKEEMKLFKKQKNLSKEQIKNVYEQLKFHKPQFIEKQNNCQTQQFMDNRYLKFEDERTTSPEMILQLQKQQIRQIQQPPQQQIFAPVRQQEAVFPMIPPQQQLFTPVRAQNIEQANSILQNNLPQEEELHEELCRYCRTPVVKLFMDDHFQECIGYIEHQFKSIETLKMVHECSVCCLDIELNDPKKMLPCGHMFHNYCLDEWLQKKKECPFCRDQVQ